jgi:hypothetical protein
LSEAKPARFGGRAECAALSKRIMHDVYIASLITSLEPSA